MHKIRKWISQVKDSQARQSLERRFFDYFQLAKFRTVDKNPLYKTVYKALEEIYDSVPEECE